MHAAKVSESSARDFMAGQDQRKQKILCEFAWKWPKCRHPKAGRSVAFPYVVLTAAERPLSRSAARDLTPQEDIAPRRGAKG